MQVPSPLLSPRGDSFASPSVSAILSPRWFFIGVAIGLLACIGGGFWASRQDIYGDRDRFFNQIAQGGSIYPTVDNLCAFVCGKVSKNKKLILVAGDSRLLGVGQTNAGLWTRRLQEKLGADYGVANVSFRGVNAASVGIPLLEILSRKYKECLLIVDTVPGDGAAVERRAQQYDYILWDAWIGGEMADNSRRDRKMRSLLWDGRKDIRDQAVSMALFGFVENLTHAVDLWNEIGYNWVFTCSASTLSADIPFYTPRRQISDDESGIESVDSLKSRKLDNPAEIKSMINSVNYGSPLNISETDFDAMNLNAYDEFISDPKERNRILFLEPEFMPFFVKQLSADQRRKMETNLERWANLLRSQGFHVLRFGKDFEDTDYWDARHFSNFASPKMADAVAREILNETKK